MINTVLIVGRITKDIELKKTSTNKDVCNFSIACERMKGKNDDKAAVDYINCQAWNHQAKYIGQYAKKGVQVTIEGRLQVRNYDDNQGKKVYVTEVIVNQIEIPFTKKDSNTAPNNGSREGFGNNTQDNNGFNSFDTDFVPNDSLDINSDDLPF